MKTKYYRTLEEVREDLKILKLKRDISLAELENYKLEMEESLRPLKIVAYIANTLKSYGVFYLIRKLLK